MGERESERAREGVPLPSIRPSILSPSLQSFSLALAPPESPFSGVEPFEWMERKKRGGGEREGDQGRRRNGGTKEQRERPRNAASMDKWIGEEKSMMRENRISRLPSAQPTELRGEAVGLHEGLERGEAHRVANPKLRSLQRKIGEGRREVDRRR